MANAVTSGNPAPGYDIHPNYHVEDELCPKWIRAEFNGETVADSRQVLIIREYRHTPVYYFPREDIRMDLAIQTNRQTYCPFKGLASYWSLSFEGRMAEDVMWSYEAPYDEALQIKNNIAFYWNKIDRWFEEEEEIFVLV